jgi:putative effector of murein hydrolase
MHGQWLIWAHLINGTLIVAGAIALYARAIKLKNKTWKIVGGVTAGSVILAWVCGEEFISKQNDLYSFAMSLFFIIALTSLGAGLYKTKQ